jgi:hypothetical protein
LISEPSEAAEARRHSAHRFAQVAEVNEEEVEAEMYKGVSIEAALAEA